MSYILLSNFKFYFKIGPSIDYTILYPAFYIKSGKKYSTFKIYGPLYNFYLNSLTRISYPRHKISLILVLTPVLTIALMGELLNLKIDINLNFYKLFFLILIYLKSPRKIKYKKIIITNTYSLVVKANFF